jgi:hypothetical protein
MIVLAVTLIKIMIVFAVALIKIMIAFAVALIKIVFAVVLISFANRLNDSVPLLSDAWLDESEKQMKKTLKHSGNSSSQM